MNVSSEQTKWLIGDIHYVVIANLESLYMRF